jgi:hypothetical protein
MTQTLFSDIKKAAVKLNHILKYTCRPLCKQRAPPERDPGPSKSTERRCQTLVVFHRLLKQDTV